MIVRPQRRRPEVVLIGASEHQSPPPPCLSCARIFCYEHYPEALPCRTSLVDHRHRSYNTRGQLRVEGRQSSNTCEYQSFQLSVPLGLADSVISGSGPLGTSEDAVISAFSTLGTREDSVISAFSTLGTRNDSVISAFGTLETREDSSQFSFWYPGDSVLQNESGSRVND